MVRQFRFKAGDRVKVRPDDPSPFAGLDATVDSIQPHDRGVGVLDQYTVNFDWGEKKTFYDAQLFPAGQQGHAEES
jgi:hypothetical protein